MSAPKKQPSPRPELTDDDVHPLVKEALEAAVKSSERGNSRIPKRLKALDDICQGRDPSYEPRGKECSQHEIEIRESA